MEVMERFELAITVLLVVLVMICVYIAVTWTMWKKQKNKKGLVEEWLDKNHDESNALIRKGFVPEGEEGLPKITITPVQPRPEISEGSAPASDGLEDEIEGYEPQDNIDLGRLYFALQYDQQRAVLRVRLIRGEDIPMERDISATYVGVRLLPLRLIGEQVQPHETSINVSFQEVYEFRMPQSELANQTLDFHICRYDRFSRKVAIGDVFLALAELGAQGIDITKEVFLCRSLIHSKEAHYTEQEYSCSEEEQEAWKTKISKSSPEKLKAQSLWKIVQAAVLKGKFRAISLGAQDTPFYWESMFSSEGENAAENNTGKLGRTYYFSSGPRPPEESQSPQPEGEDDGDDTNVEEVVRKGKRSGSFLFPSQKSDEENEAQVDGTAELEPVAPEPLQISPAPEEYYRLVPFTPFTPASPVKNQKQKDSNVSWHVPETFTTRGPDVVQALSDIYTDPRIVTTANLRQTSGRKLPTYSTDSDQGPSAPARTRGYCHTNKRKKQDEKAIPTSPLKGVRRATSKRHKRKRSGGPNLESKTTDKGSLSEPHKKHSPKQVFKIKPENPPTSSSSSEDEQETKPKKKEKQHLKRKSELQSSSTRESASLVFEAKDFSTSCEHAYPLKDRAQSAPNILHQWSTKDEKKRSKRAQRSSVSMSNVQQLNIDSSDVSSEFEQ